MVDKKKVRVYRGEGKPSKPLPDWIQQGQKDSGATDATGRWWTTNKDIANWYVKEAGNRGRMVTQDIPEEVANEHVVSKAKKDVSKFSRDPNNELFLPKEYVGKGKELTVPEVKSNLLEKADFGKFQKENQDALSTLDKEKRNLRTRRKLKEAQSRSEQVRVKFQPPINMQTGKPHSDYSLNQENFREAKIKVGNQIHPVRATYSYDRPFNYTFAGTGKKVFEGETPKIKVEGLFSTKSAVVGGVTPLRKLEDPANNTFKPSQLKQVIDAVGKRYPKATEIVGERISGIRANAADRLQKIEMGKLGKLKGKKLGLLGLGLTLGEAIRAGSAAYKAKEAEGKL